MNIYTTEVGTEIELKPYTSKIAKAHEEVEKATGMESFRKAYSFLKEAFGNVKELPEMLGGKSFETIDLQETELLYAKVVDIYRKKVNDYRTEKSAEVMEKFDGMASVLNSIEKANLLKK